MITYQSTKQFFHRAVSQVLCCFGSGDQDEARRARPSTGEVGLKDTPMSTSVHGATVPHALDSPEILHKIFASNLSARGYDAAQTGLPKQPAGQRSLDLGFRFGSASPKKPPRRLEHLTNHIKQKLSETGLSTPIPLSGTQHITEHTVLSQPLGQSQKSVGLSELLASRTVSEGGYDSDAKSMGTPTVLSAAGTIKLGPKFVRRSLATIEASQADEQPICSENEASGLTVTSSPTEKSNFKTPFSLETPAKVILTEALQIGPDESPADVLRRVSHAISDGTLKMPTTPELRAVRGSTSNHSEADWLLSLSAPKRTSSLQALKTKVGPVDKQPEFQETLRKLADRVDQAKRESGTSSVAQSLISALHPELLEYIENAAPVDVSGDLDEMSAPVTAVKINTKQVDDLGNPLTAAPAQQTKSLETVGSETLSGATSSTQSLHLFNMRISQRLASTSRAPIISSSSSHNVLSNSLAPVAHVTAIRPNGPSSISRAPTFIAIEPTRRPSDPRTRKLFEPSRSELRTGKSRRSFSDGGAVISDHHGKGRAAVPDDSGSEYSCSIESQHGRQYSGTLPLRQGSLKNANSLAIGGRSASGPAMWRQQASLHVNKTGLDEFETNRDASDTVRAVDQTGRLRAGSAYSRSASVPKLSKYIKVDTTPTPVGRRFNPSTEANEGMSEIEIGGFLGGQRGIRSSESTQAVEDRRNEGFSEDDLRIRMLTQDRGIRDGWLSQGRRTGWGFDLVDRTSEEQGCRLPHYAEEVGNKQRSSLCRRDNTSDIWYRAFQRVGDPVDNGKLLATPQFDREGRRRHSAARFDELKKPVREQSNSSFVHRRSHSVDSGLAESHLDRTEQRWHANPLAAPAASDKSFAERGVHNLNQRVSVKKNSLADLRRRLAANKSSTSTSKTPTIRDASGIWGRFASHTRLQRNGPAGSADRIKVHDFEDAGSNHTHRQSPKSSSKQGPSSRLRFRNSRSLLTLAKPITSRHNTKGTIANMSSTERAKLRRKGVVGKFKRIYRTKSSELYTFVTGQGGRRNSSTSLSPKSPELGGLSDKEEGERTRSKLGASGSGVDGTSEQAYATSLDTISEVNSRQSRSMQVHTVPWSRKTAEEWSRLYQDCVGSLSALRSDDEFGKNVFKVPAAEQRRVFSLTSAIRESTANFQAELEKDADQAKEKLLQQLQLSGESMDSPPMPGSFV